MKKVCIVILACTLSAGAFSQEKMDKMDTSMHKMAMKKDCMMMKDGKMMMMKNGETMPMTDDMTLTNGTMVMKDGTVKMKNGKEMMMKDGDCMYMDGKMKKMKMDKPMQKM